MASRQVSLLKSVGNSRIYRIKHKNRESLQHNLIILFNDKPCGDDRAGRHREPCGLSLVDLFGRVVLRSIAVHGVADEEKIKALLRPLFDTYRRDRLYMPVEVEVVG